MEMASEPPRLMALESGGMYLQYEAKGLYHTNVRLSSAMVLSEMAFTKFEVVGSSFRDLRHIRTCYNNKFLMLDTQHSAAGITFVATANEPEEDRSKSTCTLFRFVYDNNNRLGLFHQSQNAEFPCGISSTRTLVIVRNSSTPRYFGVTDLQTLVALPKHVSFIGDNDLYLGSRYIRLRNRLQFAESNRLDSRVHFEATTLNNGNVQLRSPFFDRRLWRKSNPEWIWCDTYDTNDQDTIFRPIRLSARDKTIALLNVSNNKYCMRWIRRGQPRLIGTLTASASSIDAQVIMKVEDAIRDREIYDIQYRISEARVYNVGPVLAVPKTVVNNSYTEILQGTLSYTYEELTRETFSSSHSWKVQYTARLTVTVIPKFVEGEVVLDAQYTGDVSWSKMREVKQTVTTSVTVPVPPRKRALVTMVVGQGSIDVPYSYRQRDVLLDGTHEVQFFEDGLFTGLNTNVFDYDIDYEDLDGNDNDNDNEKNTSAIKEDYKKMALARRCIITSEPAPRTLNVDLLPEGEEEAGERRVVPSKL